MDSALCLHYGALHIPSTTNRAASIARPYSSFRPSSLSLSCKASTYRTLSQHAFSSPVICEVNKPSTPSPNYDKDDCKKKAASGFSMQQAALLSLLKLNKPLSPNNLEMHDLRDPADREKLKAIIYTMMDDNPTAEECWKLFISSFSTMEMLSDKSEVKPKSPRKKI